MVEDRLPAADPLAGAVVKAIRGGDVAGLRQLLDDHPGLAATTIMDGSTGRTLLHVATDWPGHFPEVGATIAVLVAAGADVDARLVARNAETPLHWAASCDDLAALDALLDAGADIEAPGAVIAGGTPISDAIPFAQWAAARRLLERGATTTLRESAALGLMDRVESHWSDGATPPALDVTEAFWYACHGGQQAMAAWLLDRGADRDWVARWDGLTPLDAARRSGAVDVAAWLEAAGARSASAPPSTPE